MMKRNPFVFFALFLFVLISSVVLSLTAPPFSQITELPFVRPSDLGADKLGNTDSSDAFAAAILTGKEIFIDRDSQYLLTSSVNLATGTRISGGGKIVVGGTISYAFYASSSTDICFDGVRFVGIATASYALSANYCDQVSILNCSFDHIGIDVSESSNTKITGCYFGRLWSDKTYHASNPSPTTASNINYGIYGLGGIRMQISGNTFFECYVPIYVSRINSLVISGNNITTTADTGIFARATAGVTYDQQVINNTLVDCGKSAIKIGDANNLTARAENLICSGNIIRNWGLYASSGGILSSCYFDYGVSDAYLKPPSEENMNKNLTISNNHIIADSASSSRMFLQVGSTVNVVISGNTFKATEADYTSVSLSAWSRKLTVTNNIFDLPYNRISTYENTDILLANNFCVATSTIYLDRDDGGLLFSSNFMKRTTPNTTTSAWAVTQANTTSSGSLMVGNYLEVDMASEDSAQSSALGCPFSLNPSTNGWATSNVVRFTDEFRRQAAGFGDIKFPIYYSSNFGNSVIRDAPEHNAFVMASTTRALGLTGWVGISTDTPNIQ